MAKRIVVRELEPLEIVFRDKILTCTINNDALMLMTEMYGDLNELIEKEQNRPYDFVSKILFCGIKVNHIDFEYEEAKSITISGGTNLIIEVIDNFMNNFSTTATPEQLEAYSGELERLLKKMK